MALTNPDIQVLLDDVGRFLDESLSQETLSTNTEIQRTGLIQRLKPYIGDKSNINGEQENVTLRDLEEDYEEPGSIVESRPSSTSTSSSGQSECSIKIFPPFSELKSLTSKCGPLFRKEKGVFLDQWKKYWGGIYEHFLLLYYSDRDVKPMHSLNIQGYVARSAPDACKDIKKKSATFEVVCPGKKDHQFLARTMKDMEQWIAAICHASVHNILLFSPGVNHQISHSPACISKPRSKIPLPNPPEDSQSMKKLNNTSVANDYDSSEEELYHEIPELLNSHSQTNIKEKVKVVEQGPPLPPRRPLPSIPKDDESDEEMYDDVGIADHSGMYLNANMMNKEGNKTDIQMSEKLEFKNEEEKEEEEIYDDVGVQEKLSNEINLPVITCNPSEVVTKPAEIMSKLLEITTKPPELVSKPQVTAYKPPNVPKPPTVAPKLPAAVSKPPGVPKVPDIVTKPLEFKNEEEEEEIYDDVGVQEKQSDEINLPVITSKPSEVESKPQVTAYKHPNVPKPPTTAPKLPLITSKSPAAVSKPPEVPKSSEVVSKPPQKIYKPPVEISKPPVEISKPPVEISKPPVEISKPLVEISKPSLGITKNSEGNKSSLHQRIKLLEAHLQNGNMPIGGYSKNQEVPNELKSNKSNLHGQKKNSNEETNHSAFTTTEATDTLPKNTFINESQTIKSNLVKPINSNEGEKKFRTRPSVPPPKRKLSNEDQPNKSSLFKLVNQNASSSENQIPSPHPKFPNKIQSTSKLHNIRNETEAKSNNHSPSSFPNSSQPPELPPRSYLKR